MAGKKYQSEFTLNLYVQFKYLVPSESIYQLESELRKHDYHIYFIVATPIWYFRVGSVSLLKDRFSATIFSDQFGSFIEKKIGVSFNEPSDLDLKTFKIDIPHPCEYLYLIPPTGESNRTGFQANYLAREFCWRMVSNVDRHKVLYIGQSYGTDGKRLSIDRILSHATYQKILMEAPTKYPNCKIEVLFLDFAINQTLTIDGLIAQANDVEENEKHLSNILSSPVKINEAYNICEATLIYAFQPEYNKDFKKYRPSKKHKSYQEYYKLDYKNLWLELDLSFYDRPDCILFTDSFTSESPFIDMVYDLRNNTLYKTAKEFLDCSLKKI